MKKKILTTVTAVAMSLAMATSAMAAPTARESGNVDGNGSVNSNDASIINGSKAKGEHITNGTFDGYWRDINYKMTGNGQKVIDYVLTPENMNECIALRAYAASGSETYGGYDLDFVANLVDDLKLDSDRVDWNGNFTDYDARLSADTNPTVDEIATKAFSMVDASDKSLNELGSFLSGVGFEGFGKNAGKEIFLTTDEGWGVFAVTMRYIVPLKASYFEASGYEGNIDKVFNGDYGVVGAAPYNDVSELSGELQQRAIAFEAMHDIIVTNTAHSSGENNTLLGKGKTATELYNQFKIAFPSDVDEDSFRKTCDTFGEIYTRRYEIGVSDKDGYEVIDDNVDGNNSNFVNKLVSSGLYHYETATLQDVRDAFGDRIELSTSKDNGDKNWGFVLELYVAYK
ncbi:MAG: hypothetical protein ACI4VF_02060 [Lachnospirales bacterium]